MVVLLLSSSFRKICCLGHPSQICHIVRDYYSHVCSWYGTQYYIQQIEGEVRKEMNTSKIASLLNNIVQMY